MSDRTTYFRIYFDDQSATQDQLQRILSITVTQQMDQAWEAQIRWPLCLSDQGTWSDEDQRFFQSFGRVRIEVKTDGENWVPLIDGPVVGRDNNMQPDPGQSELTLLVHDDSVYLNREAVQEEVGERTDQEIVEYLFGKAPTQITETDVADLPARQSTQRTDRTLSGMPIRLIRSLATTYHMHAYVLPGENRGESVGCFKDFPEELDEHLPAMVTLGDDRNVTTFQVHHNAQQPATYVADSLSLDDKGITSSTSSFRDATLLGSQAPYGDESQTATRRLSQYADEDVDGQQAVQGASNASLYAYEGSGTVKAPCYLGVLQPFKLVAIHAGQTVLSGNYVLTRVVHHLGWDEYSQDFTAVRNAASDAEAGSESSLTGNLSVSVNVSFSIV